MTEDYELKDDVHRQQYEFRIGNYTPKIEYIKSINGEIYLTHTEVPRELEGKGIGSQLVEKHYKTSNVKDFDSFRFVLSWQLISRNTPNGDAS